MNIDLSPEIAAAIRRKVAEGRYTSEDAVVEAAMELLERRDADLEALQAAVDHGLEQPDHGEGFTYADADEFKSSVRARVRG